MFTALITPLSGPFWATQTPADIFALLSDQPTVFWLDSGNADHGWSYLGIHPLQTAPLSVLNSRAVALRTSERITEHSAMFRGGWIVNFNYPDSSLLAFNRAMLLSTLTAKFYENILAFSHAERRWLCISNFTQLLSSRSRRDKVNNSILFSQIRERKRSSFQSTHKNTPYTSSFTRNQYLNAVGCALNYIGKGDIYQVNLAQRFSVCWDSSAAELYLCMREQSPSFYGAFLGSAWNESRQAVCCISPELFLRTRFGRVETRPIKGTRPRGSNAVETESARHDLGSNAKERAELNMIIDLERNDLGRVCTHGSVSVDSSGEIEELPTLLHRTAAVSGQLKSGTKVGELLGATFPGGSITGAPKLRAMEIIAELEPVPRGHYCGAIGWIGVDGNLELNIAIRTAVCDEAKKVAHYYAGSGIVADSAPEKEYDETLLKAAAFFRAVGVEI